MNKTRALHPDEPPTHFYNSLTKKIIAKQQINIAIKSNFKKFNISFILYIEKLATCTVHANKLKPNKNTNLNQNPN